MWDGRETIAGELETPELLAGGGMVPCAEGLYLARWPRAELSILERILPLCAGSG
jgi:hypothetical protein